MRPGVFRLSQHDKDSIKVEDVVPFAEIHYHFALSDELKASITGEEILTLVLQAEAIRNRRQPLLPVGSVIYPPPRRKRVTARAISESIVE